MVPVESSDLSAIGYDASSATLTIEFRSGGVYEYSQVPYREFLELLNAESHGKYFHQNIKDQFPYRRVA
jgi:hypothetical protein